MNQFSFFPKLYRYGCFLFILIVSISFVVGCSTGETLSPTGVPMLTTTSPTVGATMTIEPTATASAISTIISTVTPTTTPSATPTSIPVPTLTPIERAAVFENFMATNGGCDLPCWWGFELGDSLESISQTFINLGIAPLVIGNSSKVDSDRIGSRNADIADYYEDEQHGLSANVRLSVDMQFHELNGSVEYIYVFVSNVRDVPMSPEFFRDWEQYNLSSFLQRYGKPTEVYFRLRSIGDPMDPPQYSVSLLYLDKGLAITYHIKGTRDELCLDIENVVALELSLFNLEGLDIWGYQFAPYNDEGYATLTWEAEMGVPLDIFYEAYEDPSNLGCIQIP